MRLVSLLLVLLLLAPASGSISSDDAESDRVDVDPPDALDYRQKMREFVMALAASEQRQVNQSPSA